MIGLGIYLMAIDTPSDKRKFEQIYIKYSSIMHKIAYRILKDEHEAEDALHNAFLKIMDHLDKINDIDTHNKHPYVVAIIESCSYDIQRKRRKVPLTPIEQVENQVGFKETFIENIEDQDVFVKVVEIIHTMKSPYKEILYLKYLNNMNSRQVGEVLGLKADNVRWHLRKAKKILSDKIIESKVIL